MGYLNLRTMYQRYSMRKQYREVSDIKTQPDLSAFQMKYLENLLIHAYKNVPYYTKVFNEIGLMANGRVDLNKFGQIPILTKENMKLFHSELLSKDHKSRQSFISTTGGSTGEPTLFVQDKHYILWGLVANRYYYENVLGIDNSKLKTAILWGSHSEVLHSQSDVVTKIYYRLNRTIFLNGFLMDDDLMGQYVNELNVFNPELMRGYASCLYQLACYIKSRGLKMNPPKYIISSAETLTDEMRKTIESSFGAKVYNFYGSRETNNIAGECPRSRMHLLGFHELVEIVKDGKPASSGEEGRVIVTNLHNYSMPFIRCDLGDLAIAGPDTCECGSPLPTLRSVTGRSNQMLYACDGTKMSPCFIPYLFYPGCDDTGEGIDQYQKIKQYQLIQEDKHNIVVKLVIGKNSVEDDFGYVVGNVKRFLGQDMKVQLKFVDSIEPLPSGKRLYVISKIEQFNGLEHK